MYVKILEILEEIGKKKKISKKFKMLCFKFDERYMYIYFLMKCICFVFLIFKMIIVYVSVF